MPDVSMLELTKKISLEDAFEQYLEATVEKQDATEKEKFYENILRFYVSNNNDTKKTKSLHKESKKDLITETLKFNDAYELSQKDIARKSMKYGDFHKTLCSMRNELENELKKADLNSYFTIELRLNLLDYLLDKWNSYITYPVSPRFTIKLSEQ